MARKKAATNTTPKKTSTRSSRSSEVTLTPEQFNQFVEEYTTERMAGFVHPSTDTGRLRADWGTSEAKLSVADVKVITNRAIRAYKSNSWLKSAIEVFRINVVEKGIKPRPAVKNDKGNVLKDLNDEITYWWGQFNDFAFSGRYTFYQKQHTILTSQVVTGNCFIIKIASKRKDSPFSFSLMLKDTRHLDFTKDTFNKNKDGSYIKHGIKYNKDDEPEEYYFTDYKEPFPADRVIHLYYEDMADDKIGLTAFLQSLPTLFDIENIFKYQLLSTRLTAGIALWHKKGDTSVSIKEASPLRIIESENKPEVIEGTSRVNQEIIPLIEQCLVSVASSFGLSKAALMRDTLKESFSGGRLRSLNDELTYETFTKYLAKVGLQGVYEWFLDDIVVSGKLTSLKSPEYNKNRWKYQQAYWQSRIKQYIDPLDQARTDAEKIKNRLMTYKDYYQSKGKDWKEELTQIAEESKFLVELGLNTDQVLDEYLSKSDIEREKERQEEKENEQD